MNMFLVPGAVREPVRRNDVVAHGQPPMFAEEPEWERAFWW